MGISRGDTIELGSADAHRLMGLRLIIANPNPTRMVSDICGDSALFASSK